MGGYEAVVVGAIAQGAGVAVVIGGAGYEAMNNMGPVRKLLSHRYHFSSVCLAAGLIPAHDSPTPDEEPRYTRLPSFSTPRV